MIRKKYRIKNQLIYILYSNFQGDLLTNVTDTEAQNAVTWGVFPGKEIVQPTLIERANFESWNEEAFRLWSEWELQYAPESDTAKLLKQVGDTYWLVNVVHNDFQLENGLFNIMLNNNNSSSQISFL